MNTDADLAPTWEDRYSYGYYPFGPKLVAGASIVLGGGFMTFVLLNRVPFIIYNAWIAGLLCFSLYMYRYTMREQSDIVLTEDGFQRYFPGRLWLTVPWTSVQQITIKRVYGTGYQMGMTTYLLTLKDSRDLQLNLPAKIKIAGFMTRKEAFYEAFLSRARDSGIDVKDLAKQ
jgi:hypothetical protein